MALVKAAACFLFFFVILDPYVSIVVARTTFPAATMAPAPSPIITTPEYASPATPPATFAPAEPPIIIAAAEDAPEAPVPDAALPPATN
ncbi:unnamed protein product [Linum trigynum]|uniref:Arabinogalactan protein n=1 Tax=Linum trigynum TaxID=586398 RepID=A0AAV2F0Y7_9ROSI